MFQALSAVADSDDNPSTAPTTPDGSLTFSPVLQAAQLLDAFEGMQVRTGRSSSATLDLDETATVVVRNICCVGAGYVGKLKTLNSV
jgi:UDPglucose 6-dehydrogenase